MLGRRGSSPSQCMRGMALRVLLVVSWMWLWPSRVNGSDAPNATRRAPFVPYGVTRGDTRLADGLDDRCFGPYLLPSPMPFPDGDSATSYYVSSNGLISFKPTTSYSLSSKYSSIYGRLISATYGDLETPYFGLPGGMFHRTVNASGSFALNRSAINTIIALNNTTPFSALWTDIISGVQLPFEPKSGLVWTVDRCPFFSNRSLTATSQTVLLWDDHHVLMSFRIGEIQYPQKLLFGGYVGPTRSFLISPKNNSALWVNGSRYVISGSATLPGVYTTLLMTTQTETATHNISTSATTRVTPSLSQPTRTSTRTQSAFNATLSLSAELALDVPAVLPAQIQSLVTFGSLVASAGGGGGALVRGAVPSMQRSAAAMQIAAQCNLGSAAEDNTFDSFAENPLGLRIPLGADDWDYAAGASIGNALIVVMFGVFSHGMHHALIWASTTPLVASPPAPIKCCLPNAASLLPSFLLPGAIALPYSALVQPSIGACAGLLLSNDGTSIACGVVLCALWLSVPLYFGWEILHRSRRPSPPLSCGLSDFMLSTRQSDNHSNNSEQPPAKQILDATLRDEHPQHQWSCSRVVSFLMEPSQEWFAPPLTPIQCTPDTTPNVVACAKGVSPASVHQDLTEAEHQHARYVLKHLDAVFGGYVSRREWFCLLDWTISLTSGLILGAAQAVSNNSNNDAASDSCVEDVACTAAQLAAWATITFSALQIVLYVWLRPFQVRLELGVGVGVAVLCLLSQVFVVWDRTPSAIDATLSAAVFEFGAVALLVLYQALLSIRSKAAANVAETGRRAVHPHQLRQLRGLVMHACIQRRQECARSMANSSFDGQRPLSRANSFTSTIASDGRRYCNDTVAIEL